MGLPSIDETNQTGAQAAMHRVRVRTGADSQAGYLMGKLLGQGASCQVFEAVQLPMGRLVALKLLREGSDETQLTRFLQEGRLLGELRHPNVVSVFLLETIAGRPALVMEFLSGGSLRERIERGALPLAEALHVVRGCLAGLQALHDAGIVHRDLKPENILFDEAGTPHVTDLGIARELQGGAKLTRDDTIIGTPRYMAPEQITGAAVSPATDVYAMGLILHELVTGAPTFDGASPQIVFAQHLDREPAPVYCDGTRQVALNQALQRVLAKRPEDRPADARAMTALLAEVEPDDRAPRSKHRTTHKPVVAEAGSGAEVLRSLRSRASVALPLPRRRPPALRHAAACLAVAAIVGSCVAVAAGAAADRIVERPAEWEAAAGPQLADALARLEAAVPSARGLLRAVRLEGHTDRPRIDRDPVRADAARARIDDWCRRELGGDPVAVCHALARVLGDRAHPVRERLRLHELLMRLATVDSVAEDAGAGPVLNVDGACSALIPVMRDAQGAPSGYRPIPCLEAVRAAKQRSSLQVGLLAVNEQRADVEVITDLDPELAVVKRVTRALDTGERGDLPGMGRWFRLGEVPDWLPLQRGMRVDLAVANHTPGSVFWLRFGARRIGLRSAALEKRATRLVADLPPGVVGAAERSIALAIQAPPLPDGSTSQPDQVVHDIVDLAIRPL